MPVLIAIVSRNSLALTKAAIASALTQDYPGGTSLLVLDNASTDSTPLHLSSYALPKGWSHIAFIHRRSVAYCWNYILEWAFSPYNLNYYAGVLMLNNDVEIRPDTVRVLMADPAPFVTAISVRTRSELHVRQTLTRAPHPDFSCFLIKPECWRKVGRFDEGFEVAYCEDCDYHVRMHLAHVEAVSLSLPFLHHGHGTLTNSDKAERRFIERAADRNRARFGEMYGCLPGTEAYNQIFSH